MAIYQNGVEIDPRLLCVTQIHPVRAGMSLSNATGFFFLRDGYLFLITARHVVVGLPGAAPDTLRLPLHTHRDDLTRIRNLELPLFDAQGNPRWREHPKYRANVDVVAIPIDDPTILNTWAVEVFTPRDLADERRSLPLGQPLLVIGFPLGFGDKVYQLPIARGAITASVYPLFFQGQAQFVTDGRMHRGASGSPVLARLSDAPHEARWRLLGVHAASVDMRTRDPSQDERLGLNLAWYASLILDLTARI